MALFLLKPVLWNTAKYTKPSGVRASPKSFPGRNGFGHEEWNNSPRLSLEEGGRRYRTFHTESIKNDIVLEQAGQTFIFMTATHGSIQQLVGVAGNAQYLGHEKSKAERVRLTKLLGLSNLADDAWAQPLVQKQFSGRRSEFLKVWRHNLSWITNWICPEEFYWWCAEPVTLNPREITGKNALPKMFSSYMRIEQSIAELIMGRIPKGIRGSEWRRLVDAMRIAPTDFVSPNRSSPPPGKSTTYLSTVQARLGQGKYRQDLIDRWGGACAVTGLTCLRVLRASHVMPWGGADNVSRLDPDNGLLLSANLDALFDAGLISFTGEGEMLVADELLAEERTQLGIPMRLRTQPSAGLKRYLAHHRTHIFRKLRLD
ncbi:HNH endonuclease [Paracidovorax avenae]|uniref:HNH endonuclease n=1 Tax=Paracidovorax avenae TaxID=80867 RepID=UPI000D15FBC3|nr:HNH endonuclease [Paracidovorax avenae]AVS93783.1 HNH endonuclease [Paracidovorax avenae]AVS99967.1 HNH endonuclease [Paracidovorax avenae]AVT06911.1 HNH endonuclease [Paracidovorax avenae]AVT21392.1 HNH endonuclease [Paracidovorax avenae]